jgi:hypothetical protein
MMGLMVVGKPTTLTMISASSAQLKYFLSAASITRFAELPLLTIKDALNPNFLEN